MRNEDYKPLFVERRNYSPGNLMIVSDGSGLDSGRVGIIQNSRKYSNEFLKKNEPGRYYNFDASTEVILKEIDTDKIFTMFKSRLYHAQETYL